MQLVVGRIAKAHGIAGEVSVDVRTDDPDHRYAAGATLDTDPPRDAPLVIESTRWHAGRLLVRFVGVADRTAAEALRGTVLVADSQTSRSASDDEDFWDHDLIGLRAEDPAGVAIGDVVDVLHPPGPAVLVIKRTTGAEALVPFVAEIVPAVALDEGRLVVDAPVGLLDL
jgi:16S rRNA processing protein RimM